MMFQRAVTPTLLARAAMSQAVVVTGPRQSGKTTLVRSAFPRAAYVNLERLDERERAREDPRGFLARHEGQVIFDEIQRCPELLSYIHALSDEAPRPGRFIHWRDAAGHEVDVVVDLAGRLVPIETKSGMTVAADAADTLRWWTALAGHPDSGAVLVHGGDRAMSLHGTNVLPWFLTDPAPAPASAER